MRIVNRDEEKQQIPLKNAYTEQAGIFREFRDDLSNSERWRHNQAWLYSNHGRHRTQKQ